MTLKTDERIIPRGNHNIDRNDVKDKLRPDVSDVHDNLSSRGVEKERVGFRNQ